MISNRYLIMDSLFDSTKPFLIDWSGHNSNNRKKNFLNKKKKIALLIGTTRLAERSAIKLVDLLPNNLYDIAVPKNIYNRIQNKNDNISLFNFKDEDFLNCDLAICRPGMGTIQDCIFFSLPMVMFYEKNNLELANNSEKISKLGMGIELTNIFDFKKEHKQKINNSVRDFTLGKKLDLIKEKMLMETFHGSDQTIDWLINQHLSMD